MPYANPEDAKRRDKTYYKTHRKECRRRAKAYRRAHTAERQSYDKHRYESNKDVVIVRSAVFISRVRSDPRRYLKYQLCKSKARANRKGMPHNLTMSYLLKLYDACPRDAITGQPFDSTSAGIISIDRINNDKGYIRGNIQLVRWGTNAALQYFGLEVFDAMCLARLQVINQTQTRCKSRPASGRL